MTKPGLLWVVWSLVGAWWWQYRNSDFLLLQRMVVDLPAIAGLPGTTSWVSYLGVALWLATGSVCVFAGSLLQGRQRYGLLWVGVLSLWLGVDDALMMHEETIPAWLSLPATFVQSCLYFLYGLAVLIACRFLGSLLLTQWSALLASLSALGLSIALDIAKDQSLLHPRSLLMRSEAFFLWCEEGLKLLGILAWTLAWIGLARQLCRNGGPESNDGVDNPPFEENTSQPGPARDPGRSADESTSPAARP